MKIKGQCLCGAITYESAAEPVTSAICHCRDCQRSTGSAFSLVTVIPGEGFSVTGEPKVVNTVGEDHGLENDRAFCGDCGSPLWTISPGMPGMVILKSGTLDDTSWIEPQLEVWGRSAHNWVGDAPEGRMRLERGPA